MPELPDGRIAYDLRRPWSDGTSRLLFEPLAFLERLSALVPPPRAHLLTYHGVLAPASALRAAIVPRARAVQTPARGEAGSGVGSAADACAIKRPARAGGRHPWAELQQARLRSGRAALRMRGPAQDHRCDHAGRSDRRDPRGAAPADRGAGGAPRDGLGARTSGAVRRRVTRRGRAEAVQWMSAGDVMRTGPGRWRRREAGVSARPTG